MKLFGGNKYNDEQLVNQSMAAAEDVLLGGEEPRNLVQFAVGDDQPAG